ncbi:hypothetical protein OHA74_11875 [Streptomyces phaeochromogenes]|uniref:hypothetical protein n=1 Tax=Streptomyces phaeochromogenes TaxID=1923 RepID=UPI002E2D1118|nr:hypothetical protein [Streptomyces phaeochromogenes]
MPGAHGVGEAVPGESARGESPFIDLPVVPGAKLRGADDGVHGQVRPLLTKERQAVWKRICQESGFFSRTTWPGCS